MPFNLSLRRITPFLFLIFGFLPIFGAVSISFAQTKTLTTNTTKHTFSNPKSPDVFTLFLYGKTLQSSLATIEIHNAAGECIYSEAFNTDLLLNSLTKDLTSEQKDQEIQKRVKEFFAEKNFITPAVRSKATYIAEFANKEEWESIRADQKAIGFGYRLDYEFYKRIAWSKKLGKVVVVDRCC